MHSLGRHLIVKSDRAAGYSCQSDRMFILPFFCGFTVRVVGGLFVQEQLENCIRSGSLANRVPISRA